MKAFQRNEVNNVLIPQQQFIGIGRYQIQLEVGSHWYRYQSQHGSCLLLGWITVFPPQRHWQQLLLPLLCQQPLHSSLISSRIYLERWQRRSEQHVAQPDCRIKGILLWNGAAPPRAVASARCKTWKGFSPAISRVSKWRNGLLCCRLLPFYSTYIIWTQYYDTVINQLWTLCNDYAQFYLMHWW